MRLQIIDVLPDDDRKTVDLTAGEVVHHDVRLDVEGTHMTFDVLLRAKVMGSFDASILNGDDKLTELLRFQPAALNAVLRVVGKVRRGELVELPVGVDPGPPLESARAATP